MIANAKNSNRFPYTYLIGWSQLNKWYYGRRTANGCNPNELWVTYFTSSKEVAKFRAEHGEPDIKEIRRQFIDIESARIWENRVLSYMHVSTNGKFLNRRGGDKSNKFNTSGTALAKTPDGRKLGPVSINDPRWETKEIVGITYGSKRTLATKAKLSAIRKNTTTALVAGSSTVIRVSVADPRWASGELVGANKGKSWKQVGDSRSGARPKEKIQCAYCQRSFIPCRHRTHIGHCRLRPK